MRLEKLLALLVLWALPITGLPRPQQEPRRTREDAQDEDRRWLIIGGSALAGTTLFLTGQNIQLQRRLESTEKQLWQINQQIKSLEGQHGNTYDELLSSRGQLEREVQDLREEVRTSNYPPAKEDEYFQENPDTRDCMVQQLESMGYHSRMDSDHVFTIAGSDWNEALSNCLPSSRASWFYVNPQEKKIIGNPRRPNARVRNPLALPQRNRETPDKDGPSQFSLAELSTELKDGFQKVFLSKPGSHGMRTSGKAAWRRPIGVR